MKRLLNFKNSNEKIFVGIGLLLSNLCFGQVSSNGIGNFPQVPGADFAGWESSVNDNLEIRHNKLGQSIRFGTAQVERMRVQGNGKLRFGIPFGGTPFFSAQWTMYIDGTFQEGMVIERQTLISTLPFAECITSIVGNATGTSVAVYSKSIGNSNTTDSDAVYAKAKNGNINYGIWAIASSGANNFAGFFQGDVSFPNAIMISDVNTKKNINPLDDSTEILGSLNPVKFSYIEHEHIPLASGIQYGFIAQEVQEVLPNIVAPVDMSPIKFDEGSEEMNASEDTFLGLQIIEIVPVIVAGGQEQYNNIIDIKAELDQLENRVNDLFIVINSQISE
jgi:hypothetical protein